MAVERGKWKIDRHVPYYSERTLANAGDEHTENIKLDPKKGLGVVGRSGWIINFGPGGLTVNIYDGEYWSGAMPIRATDGIVFEHQDDTWIKEMVIIAVGMGTTYEVSICRGTGVTPEEEE